MSKQGAGRRGCWLERALAPEGFTLIPWIDRHQFPDEILREDRMYVIGRRIDERIIGWVVPDNELN